MFIISLIPAKKKRDNILKCRIFRRKMIGFYVPIEKAGINKVHVK